MRLKYFLLPVLFSATVSSAQLAITPGAEFFVIGDMRLTLHNSDLINNGIFSPGVNTTSFTGNIASSISGNGTVRFFQLEVNKFGNGSLVLQKPINIVSRILFTSGFLDLNNFNADLETSGHLDGEREDSRVIGANGGLVLFRTVLNTPINSNPGNLGAVITSNENMGDVVIKRGHQSQTGIGLTGSILRYYDIAPTNNINLNAELKINYFDGELNTNDETTLIVFKSEDRINWIDQAFTSRNTVGNVVTKDGVNSFSRWTLSAPTTSLAVIFNLFNARCEGDKIVLTWKTAQEQNSDHFNVERSTDGIRWTVIGNVRASGNSNNEKTYSFTDNNPEDNSFYRVAEYSLDGRAHFTSILRSSCNTADNFTILPNPTYDIAFLNISASNNSQATVEVYDSKGALVKMQKEFLMRGNNLLRVNMATLANGIYMLRANWSNGQSSKSVRIVKK